MNHPNQKNFYFGIAQSAYTLTNKDELVADNFSGKKRAEISTTDRSSKYLQNMISLRSRTLNSHISPAGGILEGLSPDSKNGIFMTGLNKPNHLESRFQISTNNHRLNQLSNVSIEADIQTDQKLIADHITPAVNGLKIKSTASTKELKKLQSRSETTKLRERLS